jgi:hypothetical protein
MEIPRLFDLLPSRYRSGKLTQAVTYYFSIGDHKYTVKLAPEACTVEPGKTVQDADVVLKTTPELFEKMVVKGKMPGPIDIARGKVKTNDPGALKQLRDYFDFSGL